MPAFLEYTVRASTQALVQSSAVRVGPSGWKSKGSWGQGHEGGIIVGLSVAAFFLLRS